MQTILSSDNQLKVDDIGKIIGVWNAMVKRNGITDEINGAPLKRAIAFTDTIKHSKVISEEFNQVVNEYLDTQSTESFKVDVHHVDGGLNALEKEEQIDWLGNNDIEENHARVLSNVRFLTEGIDVPNLDAIIFFSPKKSQVDIVQAVGRIMRKAENKQYGYIILPIVVADGSDPHLALDNDKKYKQVWQVLNALRSTDERFDAEVNTLDLNKNKSKRIDFIGVDSSPDQPVKEDVFNEHGSEQLELPLDWKEMRNAFYGKVVQHVGDRRYLEDWSKDVADIAKMYVRRINDLIDSNQGAKLPFEKFLKSLRYNINDSIDQEQAVEMLAQHLITEPVFNALFSDYDFVRNNAVSKSMNDIISAFKVFGFAKEQEQLKPFYESVKLRASGIDNIQGKQTFIIQLYNSFFKTAFPRVTESMGIVFTPVEVVDFIIHSVDWALNKYFEKSLASKNVHILDPFTGTGTFITRTLYYLKQQMDEGKITYDDILRKYMQELHANEIVLLSYYIAAINIEAVFDKVNGPDRGYKPFEGIVLTDTFESTELQGTLDDDMFGVNNRRLKKQQEVPITAIISNPPYSKGQNSESENNQNIHYSHLEKQISDTYIKLSKSNAKNSLLDSYIKAFRWASDRIGEQGVIGFVTNGSYLDSNSTDGLRASLYQEFNYLYIYNLRGNARTQGIQRQKEGGSVFDQGTRTPISISILIKDGSDKHELLYRDIGDYLSRKEKLNIIKDNSSIAKVDWKVIEPDKNNDWINQRDPNYQEYVSISGEKYSPFLNNYTGIVSSRDAWVCGFNKAKILLNSEKLIHNYNQEIDRLKSLNKVISKNDLNYDPTKLNWSEELKKKAFKFEKIKYYPKEKLISYRPFVKKWMYFDKSLLHRRSNYYDQWGKENIVIVTTGTGTNRDFSSLISKNIPDYQFMMNGQGFFEYNNQDTNELIINRDNINTEFVKKYNLKKEDVFPFIYGLLNSQDYIRQYNNDLKKDLARIPGVSKKEKYIEVGKKLINLHLNYEDVPVYDKVNIQHLGKLDYKVKKMKFAKKRTPEGKVENYRSAIIFNDSITISNIPEKAYKYVVNGKSAIEWIMDQYQVKTDKKSGITDDPNDYSDDAKYIFNLLLRIINVSVQTVDLINQLPKLEIEE